MITKTIYTIITRTITHHVDESGHEQTTTKTVTHVYPSWRGIFIRWKDTLLGDIERDSGVRFSGEFHEVSPPMLPGAQARNAPTGRGPRNLYEELAVRKPKQETVANTGLNMGDPRWPASRGWEKWEWVHRGSNGNITVHYVRECHHRRDCRFQDSVSAMRLA